jgi:protocatechuate 3,4-dioxygenase alpha subunit
MSVVTTPSQTAGPYLTIGFAGTQVTNLAPGGVSGERATLRGRIIDGDGNPVGDASIEIWRANAHGKYAHPDDFQEKPLDEGFRGFGRLLPDKNGEFELVTVKPGRVPGPAGTVQAPHLVVTIFMRGLLKHLLTRIYFPDEPANAEDPILKLVPAERRATLIAKKTGTPGLLEWNVILQGRDETVFFDY